MWSRDSPFALLAIGGERHIEDRRFWVEHPQDNDTSKSDWVSCEYSLSINIKLCDDYITGVTCNINIFICSYVELGTGDSKNPARR